MNTLHLKLQSRCFTGKQYSRPAVPRRLNNTRAQSYSDQGRWSSFWRYDDKNDDDHDGNNHRSVDSNMGVLRERIEQVKMKERRRSRQLLSHDVNDGWTYPRGYNCNLRREAAAAELLQLATVVARTIGFTCLSATFLLCLLSLLLHSNVSF